LVKSDVAQVAIGPISNCNIFRGEQDAIEVNILVVAHCWNILCKRSGVSNGVIAISTTLTSCMQLPTCTFIYRNLSSWPRKLA